MIAAIDNFQAHNGLEEHVSEEKWGHQVNQVFQVGKACLLLILVHLFKNLQLYLIQDIRS